MRCSIEGFAVRAGRAENGRWPGVAGAAGGLAVALSLMETLCRVLAAQRLHAVAVGVTVSLAVPDGPGMRGGTPEPLSRALPALLRAAIGAVPPGATVEMRVEVATSEVVQLSIAGPLRPGGVGAAPDGALGGFKLPAPARRAAAMVRNHGGRVEDRSSAAAGRLRLIVRLSFNPEDALPVGSAKDRPDAGLTGSAPHRLRGPRR